MRSALLDAATDAFLDHGFEHVSLAAVANRAGANPSQITYYFGTKEGLFVEAACREVLYLAKTAEELANAEAAPREYLDVMVRSVLAAPSLSMFVEAVAIVRMRPKLHPLLQTTMDQLDRESGRAVAEFFARSSKASDDVTPARRFWVVAIGMAVRQLATGEPADVMVEEMLKILRLGAAE